MVEGWKPCPVCGFESAPAMVEGETYRDRRLICDACEWGLEVRIAYSDDFVTIAQKCRDEWNDRRTWEERTNG